MQLSVNQCGSLALLLILLQLKILRIISKNAVEKQGTLYTPAYKQKLIDIK